MLLRNQWVRGTRNQNSASSSSNPSVSVIIPFRNEELNLPSLIHCLLGQNYPKSHVIYCFVDDHSTDGSCAIVQNTVNEHEQFRLIKLHDGHGKKKAIKLGIDKSRSEIIITIDADIVVGKDWLSHVVAYHENSGNDMSILPVMLSPAKSFFEKIQQLDFINVSGITGASAYMNSPLMCNGANLCFSRISYQEVAESLEYEWLASGDDLFLMLALKQKGKQIGYYFDQEVIAHTKPTPTLSEFLSQRIRWASKTTYLKDRHIIASGLIITAAQMALVIATVLFAFGMILPLIFYGLIAWKVIADYQFLRVVSSSFGKRSSSLLSPLLTVTYPFYFITILLFSLFLPVRWKGRQLSLR